MHKKTFFKNAIFTMVLFLSMTLSAQSETKEPIDMVLSESAPHLSWIQRSEASENVFQGQKFKYDLVENNENIQKWVDQYPSEVTSYRQAIEKFFTETSVNDLIGQEKDFYYDMKAQYQMVKKLLKWKLIKQNN
jgi:hypothetical protein